ncbi:Replication protein O [Erwinia sp. E602]|uniref:replication protein n=1 Tax=Erwinia sp. E602 TaxID=2675378 RepID=UPI001BA4DB71|nr:replication protein [Erwinia sp. E602]QUG75996.1 Replication protein O [Erwinia sp. E602]
MNLAYDNVTPLRPDLRAVEQRVADLDDGYVRLATMILEEMAGADFTKRQFKVILAVIRLTYGWNKARDRIANSQISEIAKLPVKRVSETRVQLLKMNVLTASGQQLGLNKNVSEWAIPQNEGLSLKAGDKKSPKMRDFNPSNQGDTIDINIKDKIKDHSSENSGELSDDPPAALPALRPDAATQSPKGEKWGTADDLRAAEWMFGKVLTVSPTAQPPAWYAWANDIRLLRTALNTTHREICEVFGWANADGFWQTNVMSPAKLRKQWQTLVAQRSQGRGAARSSGPALDYDNTDWAEGLQV